VKLTLIGDGHGGYSTVPFQETNNAISTTTTTLSTEDLSNAILTAMNRERDSFFGFNGVSVPPLVWNPELAAAAKTWAEHLATLPVIDQSNGHSTANGAGNFYGETVATIDQTGGPPATTIPVDLVNSLVGAWINEKRNYHGEVLTNENLYSFGHYTQMMWKTTTSVGCATAIGSGHSILVCQYFPPGNVYGKTPLEGGLPSYLHEVG
jgi:uncharacterized protein YkwD